MITKEEAEVILKLLNKARAGRKVDQHNCYTFDELNEGLVKDVLEIIDDKVQDD